MDRVKKTASAVVLTLLIIASIHKVSAFLQLKESDSRYSSFLTEDAGIDVLFLGSSHVRHGFFAMELWNDYGISSYNLAANGSTLPVSYWTLVNALDYQKVQIAILDVFDMWPGRICSESWGHVHTALDFFPASINKYRMVKDLFDDPDLTDSQGGNLYEKRWELLWDMGEYHTRWTGLAEDDFKSQGEMEGDSAVWKGSTPLIDVTDRKEKTYPDSWDGINYDEISKEYLIRTIELCEDENIELILINTGYDCSEEAKLFADSVHDIAAQYHLPYLDLTQEDIINFETDLHSTDHNTHVNFSGAEKFTSYIGRFLSENYPLADHRGDEEYSSWWEDYERFTESKRTYLRDQSDNLYYFMFLADDDYHVTIEMNDRSILYEDRNQAMLENIGIDYSRINDSCNFIEIDSGTTNAIYESIDSVLMGSGEEDTVRMKISVTDKSTGEVVDIRSFQ